MITPAITEKFAAINAGLTHMHWMVAILDDINVDDCGYASYQPLVKSIHKSIELMFSGVYADFYALYELLAATGKHSYTDEPLLDGESLIIALECAIETMETLVGSQAGERNLILHKRMNTCHQSLRICVDDFRKQMSTLGRFIKAAHKSEETTAAEDQVSVPAAKPQRAKAHTKAAEAVAA